MELSDQVRMFYRKAAHVYEELGAWAADYFIFRTIEMIKHKAELTEASTFHAKRKDKITSQLWHIFRLEDSIEPPDALSLQSPLSSKVKQLVAFLERQKPEECSGLIFVQQRAIVNVLCDILSAHPRTKSRFRCATFVGLSNSAHGKFVVSELFDQEAQKDTMAEFRAGRRNIVIATDALEEGIDVAACNLVVCFNPPPSLKSYIQRRGRARMEASQYVIMLAKDSDQTKMDTWPALEHELIKIYQDEARARAETISLEAQEELVDYRLQVETTGYVFLISSNGNLIRVVEHTCQPRSQWHICTTSATLFLGKGTPRCDQSSLSSKMMKVVSPAL
jgi:ERCC4-related helicase